MAGAVNAELPHNFDPIMNDGIIKSGRDTRYPLNEESLKVFLTGYHFDRRSKKTTEAVKKLSPDADEGYVFSVYNQLFELRDTVDREKKVEGHRNEILQLRIEQLRKDLERIVSRGKIPPFERNTDAIQLNVAASKAIQTTGSEGPLNATQLETLITGISKPLIIKYIRGSLEIEGRLRTESKYFAQIVLVQQFPHQQEVPLPASNTEGLTPIEAIIDQLKQLRSHIITNRKNEKHDYDFIYERLEKAINGLRTENNFRY